MSRSILGLIYTYSCLPQIVVDSASISISQRHLQRALIFVAESSVVGKNFLLETYEI